MSPNVTPRILRNRLSITQFVGKGRFFTRRKIFVLSAIGFLLGSAFILRSIQRVSADTSTPVGITALGSAVTQDFNTLVSSGTSTITPAGWGFVETGTANNTTYTAGTGSSATGDTYSFGATSSTERAFGCLRSGALSPIIGASFTNNTGATITSLTISYTGEQWREGVTNRGAADRLDFQISTDATSLATGTYTDVNALDFSSPNTTAAAGALDGNATANRTVVSSVINGLSIGNGATFFIRWTDFDIASSDDGLAIDDFSLSANGTAVDTAPTVNSTTPGNGDIDVATNSNVNISFSEPVNVTGNWFQIACTSSGTRQVADTSVTGGPITFTINPNTDFALTEQCAVTVFATQVNDQDINDPPDNMVANAAFSFTVTGPPAVPDSVVISQVYGGGGNALAPFTNDFIELKNPGASPVSLSGWSVQYASAGGTSWQVTSLAGTLQPGQYYLVQESSNAAVGSVLPTPDATGSIAMAAAAGKVALVNNTTPLSGAGCSGSTHLVDFVGYGSGTNCSEGSATSAPSNTTAVLRANNGCKDTNNNNADFAVGSPNPRNTSSPISTCLVANQPIVPTCPGSLNTIQGTATSTNVSATDSDSTVTSASITGAAVPGITLDSVTPAGGIGGTATATLNVANTTASGTYNVTIQYSNSDLPTPQTASCTVVVTVNPAPAPFNNGIKISQVYGGGGNSGSTYMNDFIELYNSGSTPVDITGWSVQYAGATAAFAAQSPLDPPTPLTTVIPSGTIVQPGHYFLIQESQGLGGTTSNPTPDLTGSILVGSTAGKVALVASSTVLSGGTAGNCPTDPLIVDFVGYNTTATCSETSPTAPITNTTAAIRKNNGCTDTNNNANDFLIDGPIPRNSLLPAHGCGGDPTQLFGQGLATPDYLLPSSNTLLTVNVSPASIPPSTGIGVNADLTSIGGSASQQFYDDATHGDQMAGDNVFSFQQTVGAFISTGVKNIVATITDAQARSATAPITITVQSPTCGVERWSVKTGGDPDAALVDLNPVPTTIANLRSLTPPVTPPDNARFGPAENTVYVIRATMTLYKLESDVDYHIVVQDENGNTMVTEIPCPCCVAGGSPFAAGIANARHEFDAHLTATTFFPNPAVSIPVQITGVGFFDFIHGQTGVAPNGIELHPILDIKFLNNTTTNVTSNANPSQYGQSVMFTATVASSGTSMPTGNVTFSDGATVVSSSILNGSGQASFTTTSLSVGSHPITASYPGDSNSLPSTSTVLTQVVNKADQFITFAPLAGKTYGDGDFSVSATASSGLPVSFSIVSGPATISGSTVHITGAGTVTVRASQGGNGNYNAAPDVDQSFEVAKAGQVITFAALSDKTYGDPPFTVSATGGGSGNPVTFGASGNCTAGGTNGSTITITGAGPCTVTASQAGNSNYNAAPDVSRSFTVNQATATINVSGYTGVYDGSAHGASGTATGVDGEDLTSLLNLGASFTNVPGGTAHWTFAGNTNYAPASGDVAITITKASSTTTVTCPASETYTGAALTPCSVVVTGANLSLTPGASYANNTNVGTATASYTYAGDSNHDGSSDSKNFEITKANATISVTPYSVTYDGNPHTATGTATGVNGESLSGLDLSGTTHTNAGAYNGDVWTFTDVTGNYNNTSGTVNDSISQVSASITVHAYSGVYDGSAHGATGSATGVNGENLGGLLNLGASFTNVPGGTAHWTFAGDTNYNSASGDVAITITKATPLFSNLSSPTVDCGTATVTLSGKLTLGALVPTGSVAITLNSVTQNAAIQPDGSFSANFPTSSLIPANSPYGVTFSYGGNSNFNPASAGGMVTVVDHTPPTISCPAPITVDATSAAGAVVTYTTPTASDSCAAPVTVSCAAPSGSTFPIGTTTVVCTARDASNNTASCPFNVTVGAPRKVKQDVLAALMVLRAAATDKKDRDELDDAIKHLNNALDPKFWVDDSHPTEKDGEKVFNEEKDVVKELAELIKNKKSMNPTDAALMDLIARLVQADRELALISISEETDPKKIAKAMDEIAKGDADRDTDKPDHADNAINHYKNAWKKT
jgi:hypothetical protein